MEKDQGEPPLEIHRGKFNSLRDQMLYQLSLDGWANQSSGDVESVTGFFARISIAPAELHEIVQAFSDEFDQAGFKLTGALVGHHLMVEDSDGFVQVHDYPDEGQLVADFQILEARYQEWRGEDE